MVAWTTVIAGGKWQVIGLWIYFEYLRQKGLWQKFTLLSSCAFDSSFGFCCVLTTMNSLLLLRSWAGRSRTHYLPPHTIPLPTGWMYARDSHSIVFHSDLSIFNSDGRTNKYWTSQCVPDPGLGSFHRAAHLILLTTWCNRCDCFHFKIEKTVDQSWGTRLGILQSFTDWRNLSLSIPVC